MSENLKTAAPLASIVVPFLNLANSVDQCIRSLLEQSSDGFTFEIIAVDNTSHDGTLARLQSFVPHIRVLQQTIPGAAAARNCGIRAARGRYVALIDGDCVADRQWLAALMARAQSLTENVILGGPILPKDPDTLVAVFSRQLFDQRKAMTSPRFPYAASGNMLVSRSLLLHVGLFDETFLRSHDVDFSWRALKKCSAHFAFVPEARVLHENPRTLGELFREGMKHGKGQANISTRHSDLTGISTRRRITAWTGYRPIISNFFHFTARLPCRGKHAAVSRAFHFYWGVFNGGKQLGCVLQGARILLDNRRR
jgi:glycosyltransferase involved in cell wall biosynthesis